MGARINTIMQTCFLRHLRRPAPGRGHRRTSSKRSKRPTAKRAKRSSQQNFAGGRRHAGPPASRSRCRTADTSTFDRPPVVPDGPGFRPARSPPTSWPARATFCRFSLSAGRHLADRHHPMRKAQHRPGDPPLGSERSASSAANAPLSVPHAAIRAKVYDPHTDCRGAGSFQPCRCQGQGFRRA